MEANKTVNEELRGQKSTNMLIGYVLALAAMFVAFEYTQREVKVVEEDKIYDYRMEEDMIPITQQQEVVAPPPAAARYRRSQCCRRDRSRWPCSRGRRR